MTTPRRVDPTPDERVFHQTIQAIWKDFQKNPHRTKRLCPCLAEPLWMLTKDVHIATRGQWDDHFDQYYDEIVEHDRNIVVRDKTWVTWSRYTPLRQTYVTVHYQVGHHEEAQVYWIQGITPGEQCFVETNQPLQQLLYLQDKVTSRGNHLGDIYQPWKCSVCSHVSPSTVLACQECYSAKFWSCPNPTCELPQLFGHTECYKCKTKK